MTCLRLVTQKMDWPTAKSTCESAGEYMAVFGTLESVQWLVGYMNNNNTSAGKQWWYGLWAMALWIAQRVTDEQVR